MSKRIISLKHVLKFIFQQFQSLEHQLYAVMQISQILITFVIFIFIQIDLGQCCEILQSFDILPLTVTPN